MPRESIKYKSLDPGCVIDIHAMSGDFAEERFISSARRSRRPAAGLIVETDQRFVPGTMVLLELAFDSTAKYRSRGMVSWFVEGASADAPSKMGVTIFGMEKLEPTGLPYQDTPLQPPQIRSCPSSSTAPSVEDAAASELPADTMSASTAPPRGDIVPLPREEGPASGAAACPPQQPETTPLRKTESAKPSSAVVTGSPAPPAGGMGNRWELLTLCTPTIKSADWRRADHFDAVNGVPSAPPRTCQHPSPGFGQQVTDVQLDTPVAATETPFRELRSTIPPTFIAFRPNPGEAEIPIDVDSDFDAEGAMIDAFDHMHELFSQQDRGGAALFAVNLARRLVTSEAALCYLVSPEKYELLPAVARPESELPWATTGRSAQEGALGIAIRTGSSLRLTNPADKPELEFDDGGFPTRHLLIAPIAFDGYLIGALELRNSPRETGFSSGEADLLTYIGTALAEFIHNSLPDGRSSIPSRPF